MVETIPQASVVHAISNRTRLRISSRRGDTVFFASLATALAAMAGVKRVAVQPVTGSVLLEHTKSLPQLVAAAEEAKLFRLPEPWRQPQPATRVELSPRLLIGIGMGFFGLWQLSQGRVLPPAITLGWYAASLTGFFPHHDGLDTDE